jgi:hypothetical protein
MKKRLHSPRRRQLFRTVLLIALSQPVTPLAAFGPSSVVESTTATAPTTVGATMFDQTNTVPSVAAVVAPAKKNRLWLWITLGVAVVVVLALVASYFVMKNAADVAAHAYTASAKTYLDDTYDAAVGAAADPADIKKAVDTIKVPVLESTLVGGLSSDYTSAKNLQTEVASKVKVLSTKIGGYAQVYAFYNNYTGLFANLATLDSQMVASLATNGSSKALSSAYLKNFGAKLDEIVALISKTDADSTVPTDFHPMLKDLGTVFNGMSAGWNAASSAYDSGDKSAGTAGVSAYKKAYTGLDDAKGQIVMYVNALSSKTHDAAKDLQTYRNTIK